MRLSIHHETRYSYATPPSAVIEVVRLTPYNTANQSVRDWRIDVTGDAMLSRDEDAFGNCIHTFTLTDPGTDVVITATGTVETEPHGGIVSGTRERLPLGVYLRETDLTRPDRAIASLASWARARSDGTALDRAHKLNVLVYETMRFDQGATDVGTAAAEALAHGHGVCQDLAHVLIAAARADGFPARYVSGYQFAAGRARDEHASHAWAEIFVDGLGWVSFDPTAGTSTTDAYVRIAVGLDYLGASPVRGAVYGGSGETLRVDVAMDQRTFQVQAGDRQTQAMGGQGQSSQ
jgi:transglutaminase-like putative cysteine protease